MFGSRSWVRKSVLGRGDIPLRDGVKRLQDNLFLRKQLALFQERKPKPRRCRRCHSLGDGYGEPILPVARSVTRRN